MHETSQPVVFVDVETTGVSAARGKIIEIAALRYEAGQPVASLTSFINPQTSIPANITRLTGISDQQVSEAPDFAELASQLDQLLDGAILIAHNVRFDYAFLRAEFGRLSIAYQPKMLCTVRLSRTLYPQLPRHRLADLIRYHGFSTAQRHRAYDDAYVLVQFWQQAVRDHGSSALTAAISQQLKAPSLPRHIDPAIIDRLPHTPGVYIFRDQQGLPIYIGKSIDIKKRVLSHFSLSSNQSKAFKITQQTHSIDYEETAGELAALLRESHLIKQYLPLYNRRLRRLRQLSILERQADSAGYHHLVRRELTPDQLPEAEDVLAIFERRSGARQSLEVAITAYDLCPKLSGLEKSTGACFRYQLGKCRGACIGQEPPASYNRRIEAAYAGKNITAWPYQGQVILREKYQGPISTVFVVDRWIIRGLIHQAEGSDPHYVSYSDSYDHDAYLILRSFMLRFSERLEIKPYEGSFEADF